MSPVMIKYVAHETGGYVSHSNQPFLFPFDSTVIITARVAKRAKVMFSQAFVCPSPGGGGRCYTKCNMGPCHNTSPPHLGLGHSTPPAPPPGTWSLHSPPPGTWSLHSPPHLGLGHSTPPPPQLGLGHSTPPRLHAGGRYTSYWNAFLFQIVCAHI